MKLVAVFINNSLKKRNCMISIFYKLNKNNIFFDSCSPRRYILMPPPGNRDFLKKSRLIESIFISRIGAEQLDAPFRSNLLPENFYDYYTRFIKRIRKDRFKNIKLNKQEALIPRESYPYYETHYFDHKNFLLFK